MLQDIEKGKRAEIDSINGAIVRLGKEANIPTPANEILTGLVEFHQERSAGNIEATAQVDRL